MILDIIGQQVTILRRPLAAVVLSTLARRSSPMLLLLHWHGFAIDERRRSSPPSLSSGPSLSLPLASSLPPSPWPGEAGPATPASGPRAAVPLPSSALQLELPWTRIEQLDEEMLDAAWQLGAWNLVREERRGCNTVGASTAEAAACRQAFGDNPFDPDDDSHLVSQAPDRAELRDRAARLGYIRWEFRPVAEGMWRAAGQDDSLLPNGRRLPPCPVMPRAASGIGGTGDMRGTRDMRDMRGMRGMRTSRNSYQLGRINRIVLL